ncbi:signal peptidase I [Arthrobacter globiformis]|uniref:Signal peptidase I n=1 Tax=Arthrobacter globiformis TaxID=1665 RepID=A0A328HJW4_ARTGO|nr:signal peptidase I [Arthrobacter globiformis]RAM37303.1 signal peptidase I [Arthrobacter globiformis]
MSSTLELAGTAVPDADAVPARPDTVRGKTRTTTTSPARRVARHCVKGLTTALMILAVGAFLLLAIGPRVLGYQTSTMLTGSMSPLINPGDVVVTVPVPVKDVKAGDIITYHIPVEDHRVETHRITEITTTADGRTAVQTKGDANNGVDPWVATLQDATVDRHVLTIPFAGTAIRALRDPVVMKVLMYGAPGVLVVGMLASIWRKNPEPGTANA